MQVRNVAILLALVCLLPCAASAQEALRVSPGSLAPGDEAFLTVFVGGTLETDIIAVTFAGPGGQVTIEPNYRDHDQIIVWVPDPVLFTEGRYSVDVFVTRNGQTSHFGPGFFNIAFPPEPEHPPLLLNVPEVVTAEAGRGGTAVINYQVSASDGTPVICTPPSGSTLGLGITMVNCVADNGVQIATAEFGVFVQDTIAPVITMPADITTENAVVTFTVTAVDENDPDPDIFCFPGSGTTFPGGTTTVQCFAVDAHSNFDFGTFKVTVVGGAPVITVPADILAEATSANGAPVSFTVTATENGAISCTHGSGDVFPIGFTDVTCTATNAIGSDSETFTITVADTTPPALNLPSAVTAEATSAAGAVVTYVATATDLVDGSVAISCVPASGSQFAFGTTIVQCTASDSNSNTATGTFQVRVRDTTPPVIILVTPSQTTMWPPDHKMVPVTVNVVALDSVDPTPTVTILSVSSNQPVNGTGDGDTGPDWEITGPLSVNLRSERSGNQDRIYTITVQATDDSGNSSTSTTEVRVTQQSAKRRSGR